MCKDGDFIIWIDVNLMTSFKELNFGSVRARDYSDYSEVKLSW